MTSGDAPPDVRLSGTDLLAFVVTAELGSINAAADALNLTPSAVTKRVQSLERRAGARLLHRGPFGARTTAAGGRLYPEARQAVDALQRAYEAIGGERGTARTLRLAASHTVGEFLLPSWLARFRVSQPDVPVQVDVVNSRAVRAAVTERIADVGFVEDDAPAEGLTARSVRRDEIVVVVAAGHRWTAGEAVDPAQLQTEPYLTREAGSGTRAVAEAALARAGVRLRPALEIGSLQNLKRTLLHEGFALLSALVADAEIRSGSLRTLPVAGVNLTRTLSAIRHPGELHPTAEAFWAWIERHAWAS